MSENKSQYKLGMLVAHATWLSPIVTALSISAAAQLPMRFHRYAGLFLALGIWLIPISIVAAIVTLVSIRKYGIKHRLVPAIIGLLLNAAVLFVLFKIRLPYIPGG